MNKTPRTIARKQAIIEAITEGHRTPEQLAKKFHITRTAILEFCDRENIFIPGKRYRQQKDKFILDERPAPRLTYPACTHPGCCFIARRGLYCGVHTAKVHERVSGA